MPEIDSNKIKSISLIVPLFNESKRIAKSLPVIEGALDTLEKKLAIAGELVLVNDGSTDDTLNVVKSMSRFRNTKIVSYPNNSGKGYAIKKGFEAATGNFIFFVDADLSTPINYIEEFLQYADNAIIIGSRKLQPDLIKVPQSFIRQKGGRAFTIITNFILRTSVTDFTCGFKMFPSAIGKKIFRQVTISRWGFDAEVIYLAKYFGYTIHEVPVVWSNDTGSKVRLSKDVLGSLWDIIKIRINGKRGLYERQ